mmetsp:Transcript_27768/g.63616  ORF Transcript_27768/g.63616 Transcript_27768/m.63616 type:complete len:364 (+) Transcript_27768:432-1523(+)
MKTSRILVCACFVTLCASDRLACASASAALDLASAAFAAANVFAYISVFSIFMIFSSALNCAISASFALFSIFFTSSRARSSEVSAANARCSHSLDTFTASCWSFFVPNVCVSAACCAMWNLSIVVSASIARICLCFDSDKYSSLAVSAVFIIPLAFSAACIALTRAFSADFISSSATFIASSWDRIISSKLNPVACVLSIAIPMFSCTRCSASLATQSCIFTTSTSCHASCLLFSSPIAFTSDVSDFSSAASMGLSVSAIWASKFSITPNACSRAFSVSCNRFSEVCAFSCRISPSFGTFSSTTSALASAMFDLGRNSIILCISSWVRDCASSSALLFTVSTLDIATFFRALFAYILKFVSA